MNKIVNAFLLPRQCTGTWKSYGINSAIELQTKRARSESPSDEPAAKRAKQDTTIVVGRLGGGHCRLKVEDDRVHVQTEVYGGYSTFASFYHPDAKYKRSQRSPEEPRPRLQYDEERCLVNASRAEAFRLVP